MLEVSHRCYVKLEEGLLSDLTEALKRQESRRAAAFALSMCAKAGRIDRAPIELMRDQASNPSPG